MPDEKVSVMPAATSIGPTADVLPLIQAGTNKKVTPALLAHIAVYDLVVAPSFGPFPGGLADYVCDGTADEVEINAAITAAKAQSSHSGGNPVEAMGKPSVLLLPGLYNVAAPIRLKDGVLVRSMGRTSCELRVAAGFTGSAVFVMDTVATELFTVRDLGINGNGVGSVHAFDLDGTGYSSANVQFADQAPALQNLYVQSMGGKGIYTRVVRALQLQGIRIVGCAGNGLDINSPDGFANMIDVGGSGGHGIYWAGTNWRVTNCKSWFSVLNGWEIQGSRNAFVGVEAQDNRQHGFHVGTGDNTLQGAIADSNSFAPGDANVGLYDGFLIDAAGRVCLTGFVAKEGSYARTIAQRYGVNIGSTTTGQYIGSNHQNLTGGVNIQGTHPRAGLTVITDGTQVVNEVS